MAARTDRRGLSQIGTTPERPRQQSFSKICLPNLTQTSQNELRKVWIGSFNGFESRFESLQTVWHQMAKADCAYGEAERAGMVRSSINRQAHKFGGAYACALACLVNFLTCPNFPRASIHPPAVLFSSMSMSQQVCTFPCDRLYANCSALCY